MDNSNNNISFIIIFTIIFHCCFIFEIGVSTAYAPAPSPSSPLPPNIIRDYNAIQRFKSKITYDPQHITDSWVKDPSKVCTSYKGFACDVRPDTGLLALSAVDFNGYNFNGPKLQLQGFIDELKDLAIFHANSNNFTGEVPQGVAISNINFLYELDLSNNNYTGPFPKNALEAKNLTFLDIRFNQFNGPVPSQAFNLDLDVLFLNDNQFDHQLPDNIGDTPALYLTFANNKFSGPIPSSIGRAKNLLEVLFLNNNFTGCLPYEIGHLRNATVFDVSGNQLTGPIPQSFGCLEKMEILNLADNQFHGQVPEIVCKLPNLQKLILSGNYFTHVGPECKKLMWSKKLDVGNNCILGLPYQKRAKACKEFISKRKICPKESSMKYITCKINANPQKTEQPSALRTYAALSPNN